MVKRYVIHVSASLFRAYPFRITDLYHHDLTPP